MPALAAHVVARVEDFADGDRRLVRAGRSEIGVFRVRGGYYALPNVCAHQGGPLCRGRVSGTLASRAATGWRLEWVREGEVLICPWHGQEYDLLTGRCLGNPRVRLRQYPVRVEHGQVVVEAGPPAETAKGR